LLPLKAGGGILSTVKAVRAAPQDALASQLAERLAEMRELGTGAVEVKTGYGLDTATELKMLEAIRQVAKVLPMMVVPTVKGRAQSILSGVPLAACSRRSSIGDSASR
jgi:imidazolonepropionase